MKILLIAGHGEGDPGACGNGYREADLTREVIFALDAELSLSEAEVDLFDITQDMYQRLKRGTDFAFGAYDYVFEVHFNSASNQLAHGVEIHVTTDEEGTGVEDAVLERMAALGFKNRGVKRTDFTVIRRAKNDGASAALLEVCFISNRADMELYQSKKSEVASAIAEGICEGFGLTKKGERNVARTVMKLPGEVYVQEINPMDFELMQCDCAKREVSLPNYFNAGFFAVEKGGKTIPVGNLANNGEIWAQAKHNASWLNTAKKKLTTIFTRTDGTCGIMKTNDLGQIEKLKTAISGIPIIVGGKYVSMEEIKAEGYFGSETYDTWHGFLGIRRGKLVYAAMKCGFEEMCWALVALGIYDAVKLDGGGSFVLKNGTEIEGTRENRRIQNVGIWKG